MEVLRYHSRPSLRSPVLVAAFRSTWLDAGEAASGAARFLRTAWNAKRMASVDVEHFYDFTVVRPQARTVDGRREIDWPTLDFWCGEIDGADRDAIVLTGFEPALRWKTFTRAVMDVVRNSGVEVVVTLGSFPAQVPHTRPAGVMGVALDNDMALRYGLATSAYQGPVGVSSVIAEAARKDGIPVIHLVARVPHYVPTPPTPNGSIALVRAMGELLSFDVDVRPLERELADYRERVQRAVEADPEIARYVKMLEKQLDDQEVELPSADELAQQFEDFLRSQRDDE